MDNKIVIKPKILNISSPRPNNLKASFLNKETKNWFNFEIIIKQETKDNSRKDLHVSDTNFRKIV